MASAAIAASSCVWGYHGRVPKCHDCVPHVFVDRPIVLEDDVGHRGQIFIDKAVNSDADILSEIFVKPRYQRT